MQFNISWIRAGHPLLNVGDLSIEATQSLGLLLDQLRFPTVKSLSNAETIVLINRYFGLSLSYASSIFLLEFCYFRFCYFRRMDFSMPKGISM